MILISTLASFYYFTYIKAEVGSWLECPPSYGALYGADTGNKIGPCDGSRLDQESSIITDIKAGQRLKVSWPSVNQGGGLVRLALVPEAMSDFHEAYDKAVIKMACFGSDQRYGRLDNVTGFCNHPCNGRPGCHYQENTDDIERYDTTIGIPINLEEGVYVLQWKALVGNDPTPYYSCSKLYIVGGDPKISNCTPPPIRGLNCRVTSDGPKPLSLMKESNYGGFCFLAAPGFGNQISSNQVDSTIKWIEPANRACDARRTCALAEIVGQCEKELIPIKDCIDSKINLRLLENYGKRNSYESGTIAELTVEYAMGHRVNEYVPSRPRRNRDDTRRRDINRTNVHRLRNLDAEDEEDNFQDLNLDNIIGRYRDRGRAAAHQSGNRNRQRQAVNRHDRSLASPRRDDTNCFCPPASNPRRGQNRNNRVEDIDTVNIDINDTCH